MIAPNILTNQQPDASLEASGPLLGVSFYTRDHLIARIAFFSSFSFLCHIYGNLSLKGEIFSWTESYLNKEQPRLSLPLDFTGLTPFTIDGLKAIQAIPLGQTASYKDIANQVGNPHAARAIGGVCNRNPFPLVIPCHRVISADQTLGGFAYGLDIKKRLLVFES